jgi:hypothetical protein
MWRFQLQAPVDALELACLSCERNPTHHTPHTTIYHPPSTPSPSKTNTKLPLLISTTLNPQILEMDALVSQYSRPAYQDEGYSSDEQLQLSEVTPSLSLKFALPPIAQVYLSTSF